MYQLHQILPTAKRIEELLSPHCDHFHIAGSISRKQHTVKDIEAVCQPKKEFQKTDLFGGGRHVISKDFIETLAMMSDKVVVGHIDGRYMKIILKGGKPLDLFLPQPDDYFRILTIRTGSKEYVHNVIAVAWLRKGWCGVKNLGLRLKEDCQQQPDKSWKLIKPVPTLLPPAWQSEGEFYEWLGVPYDPPTLREFKPLLNQAQ